MAQLKNGTRIRTRVGRLSVLGVADMLNPAALVSLAAPAPQRDGALNMSVPSSQASFYINQRFILDADILASNGIIHVLEGPLEAPPPRAEVGGVSSLFVLVLRHPDI